jgi:phosphotransacetylase
MKNQCKNSADYVVTFSIISMYLWSLIVGPIIQKVADAVAIAKKAKPNLLIDGPLQVHFSVQ